METRMAEEKTPQVRRLYRTWKTSHDDSLLNSVLRTIELVLILRRRRIQTHSKGRKCCMLAEFEKAIGLRQGAHALVRIPLGTHGHTDREIWLLQ
mmetsp:Transcript_519/g.800  ORF Transcript_519/g.800 Transcript_519/m.800 type:complete len:95 (+) Transcript_519:403-687(+)